MKNLLFIFAVALGALLCYFFTRVPEGSVLVSKSEMDSLLAICQQPPDSVILIDTVYIEKSGLSKTNPVTKDSISSDSLIKPDLQVRIVDKYNDGKIERNWTYTVLCPQITKSTTINSYVPKPVYINKPTHYNYFLMAGYGINGININGGIIRGNLMIGVDLGKRHACINAGILF